MKTIFIFLIGLSFTACRTLPIAMSEEEVLGEPLEDAEFPGGYEKLQTYIASSLDYFRIENGLSGSTGAACKVIVRFDVEKNGSISNAAIEKSTGNCLPCEREALRLVQDMPNWTPAKMNGLPIVNPVRLPLTFADTKVAQIYDSVDVEAEFPGGADSLRKFIFDNINMDAILEFSDKEMHNKVYVRFVINKDGDVEQVVIDRAGTYCPPCNKEALRLVKSMPKWTPGIVDGRAVSMYFRLPIIFSVQ